MTDTDPTDPTRDADAERVMADRTYRHALIDILQQLLLDHGVKYGFPDALDAPLTAIAALEHPDTARLRAMMDQQHRDHCEEERLLEAQIDYAIRYGERDGSMGQPQSRRQTVAERLRAAEARVAKREASILRLRYLFDARDSHDRLQKRAEQTNRDAHWKRAADAGDGYIEALEDCKTHGDLTGDLGEGSDE